MKFSCALAFLFCSILIFAKEPHSRDSHDYQESVFRNERTISLEEAIEKAFKASPRLMKLEEALVAAKAAEMQKAYWSNPEFTFEAENIGGSGSYSGTESAEVTYTLSQGIEIGGKRVARKSVSRALTMAAFTEVEKEKTNLKREVTIAYYLILSREEVVNLLKQQKELTEEVLGVVTHRVDTAKDPKLQMNKANVAYLNSVIALERSKKQLSIAKESILKLWNETDLNVATDHKQFFLIEPPKRYEDYVQMLERTPEYLYYTYLLDEKRQQLKLEKAYSIPDPTLSVGYRDFSENREHAFNVAISFKIPIFNRNQGTISESRAKIASAHNQVREMKLVLEQKLLEVWENWSLAYAEAMRIREAILPAVIEAFNGSLEGYEKGAFSYLDLLDTQRMLFETQSNYYNALEQCHIFKAEVISLIEPNVINEMGYEK